MGKCLFLCSEHRTLTPLLAPWTLGCSRSIPSVRARPWQRWASRLQEQSLGAALGVGSGELGSEVGGGGDCGGAGLLASHTERLGGNAIVSVTVSWKPNCVGSFPVTFPSLLGKPWRSDADSGSWRRWGCRPLPTEDVGVI